MAWAHPKYGHILASCSYDGKVLIWKEQQVQGAGAGSWTKVKEHTLHTASGELAKPIIPERNNADLECDQDQLGFLVAILAYASSDGKLSVLTFKSEWQHPYRLIIFH